MSVSVSSPTMSVMPEAGIHVPDNPATALFGILRGIPIDGPDRAVQESWEQTVGHPPGSVEFVRVHSQAMSLFLAVRDAVRSESGLSDVYEEFLPAWYDVLCYRGSWGEPGKATVRPEVLKILSALGTTLARGPLASPWTGTAEASITESLRRWLDVIDSADIPPDVADDIRARVSDLEWLMERVRTFGAGPISRAATDLVMSRSGDIRSVDAVDHDHEQRGEWKAKLVAAVASTFAFLHFVNTGSADVAGILTHSSEIRAEYEQLTSPQRAIEAAKTRSLPPGNGEEDSGAAIGGEGSDGQE